MVFSKTGPKPKGIGRRFATMAWLQALSLRTGLTAGQLGKRYLPDLISSEHNSNIFYKYRNGSSFPTAHHRLIEMKHIDLEMDWLYGDLFDLIDNKHLRECDLMISFSSSSISDAVTGDYWTKGFNFLALREDSDWLKILNHLREFNNLEAWTAIVMVLRQCRLASKLGLVYQYGCYLLLDNWRVIYSHPILGAFAENLYYYLEKQFMPKSVPIDISGSVWIEVSEAHALRIQCAQDEMTGWTPEKATIPAGWYKKYLSKTQ